MMLAHHSIKVRPTARIRRLLSRVRLSCGSRHPVGERGFTLTELMVALTGGLFVSIAVFALARHGSRFYQQESRVANATMAGIVGFERLKADISRAGFLTSPNVVRDPAVCGQPVTNPTWPSELKHAASIRVEQNHLTGHAVLDKAANGNIQPDRITLAGSFDSADQFPIRNVSVAGTGYDVYLETDTGPMARLGVANLATVFRAGRGFRIVDKSGRQHYGTIASVNANAAQPVVTLTDQPQLQFRTLGNTCGLKGFETGALGNVVNFVRYELRSLAADANHASLFVDTGPHILADDTRVELVRYEIDTAGAEIAGTMELISELAVDLEFGVTAAQATIVDGQQLLTVAVPGTAAVSDIAGDTAAGANTRPQAVRTLRARLGVRSREADRAGNVLPTANVAPGLYRIALNPDESSPALMRWARVRTIQADIALHNQRRVTW